MTLGEEPASPNHLEWSVARRPSPGIPAITLLQTLLYATRSESNVMPPIADTAQNVHREGHHHKTEGTAGGSGGIRTPDLGLMSPLLYP
jgi:hypothetical protein